MKCIIPIECYNGGILEGMLDIRLAAFSMQTTACAGDSSDPHASERFPPLNIRIMAANAAAAAIQGVLGIDDTPVFQYEIDSPGLEDLLAMGAEPTSHPMAQLLAAAIIESVLDHAGIQIPDDLAPLRCAERHEYGVREYVKKRYGAYLCEHAERLREAMSFDQNSAEISLALDRAEALERDQDPAASLEIVRALDMKEHDVRLRSRCALLLLRASTRLDASDATHPEHIRLFQRLAGDITADPDGLRTLHFTWIRYLQDRRSFRDARKAAESFEQSFAASRIPVEQRALLDYIKGRTEYYQGEYIGALDKLEAACAARPDGDDEMLADILNTTAAVMTDNLYFDAAEKLFIHAENLRRCLRLPSWVESLSGRGTSLFKGARFADALRCFQEAYEAMKTQGFIEEENRILNYIAKAQLFNGDPVSAEGTLDAAQRCAVSAIQESFSNAIRMALYVRCNDFERADRWFREQFFLPEKRAAGDPFAVAWGYLYQAEACAKSARPRDAAEYLARAARYFVEDRYVLEAAMATLLPTAWRLESSECAFFDRLVADMNLTNELAKYVDAHADLPKRYPSLSAAGDLGDAEGTERLANLATEIATVHLNPDAETAAHVFSSVCLL